MFYLLPSPQINSPPAARVLKIRRDGCCSQNLSFHGPLNCLPKHLDDQKPSVYSNYLTTNLNLHLFQVPPPAKVPSLQLFWLIDMTMTFGIRV